MTLPKNHVHISEREPDGSWEDCTWDSGLEWYRLVYDPTRPATHTEAQRLRAASGEPATGGSNTEDLRRGIRVRYSRTVVSAVSGFAALWAALDPGTCAMVQGSMRAFGPDHRLSKYDRNFDGGHAVMCIRLDATDRVWWCDPEAPANVGYNGIWVTKAELKAFVTAFAGTHLVKAMLPDPTPAGGDMPALTTYIPGYTALVKPQSNIRSAPIITASTKLRTTPTSAGEPVTLAGTVKGDVDPINGSDVWYTWWKNGRWEFTAKDNIVSLSAPTANDGYTKATQDAAVAAQKAADAVAQEQAVDTAVKAEQARVRGVLGL